MSSRMPSPHPGRGTNSVSVCALCSAGGADSSSPVSPPLASILHVIWRDRKNCEKRLLTSSRMSVLPHGTTRLPLNRVSRNLIFEDFSKTCRENSSLIKL
jgi:hypothetical protein